MRIPLLSSWETKALERGRKLVKAYETAIKEKNFKPVAALLANKKDVYQSLEGRLIRLEKSASPEKKRILDTLYEKLGLKNFENIEETFNKMLEEQGLTEKFKESMKRIGFYKEGT